MLKLATVNDLMSVATFEAKTLMELNLQLAFITILESTIERQGGVRPILKLSVIADARV